MRVIYMGKNKPSAVEGLKFLLAKNIEVAAVVAPPVKQSTSNNTLNAIATSLDIPTVSDQDLYRNIKNKNQGLESDTLVKDIDLVISFLFWKKIKQPLIDLPKIGCINLHPAPLPDFRGVAGYSIAIYENLPTWGCSAHFVDQSFDTGDLIKVNKFEINAQQETSFSLEQKTQKLLLELFKEVIEMAVNTDDLPRIPQGEGRYINQQYFENLRKIKPDDTLEQIERKIRAFWYPPYGGACLEIQGKEFTIVDESLLNQISQYYHLEKVGGLS